jgi:hypothetical protein
MVRERAPGLLRGEGIGVAPGGPGLLEPPRAPARQGPGQPSASPHAAPPAEPSWFDWTPPRVPPRDEPQWAPPSVIDLTEPSSHRSHEVRGVRRRFVRFVAGGWTAPGLGSRDVPAMARRLHEPSESRDLHTDPTATSSPPAPRAPLRWDVWAARGTHQLDPPKWRRHDASAAAPPLRRRWRRARRSRTVDSGRPWGAAVIPRSIDPSTDARATTAASGTRHRSAVWPEWPEWPDGRGRRTAPLEVSVEGSVTDRWPALPERDRFEVAHGISDPSRVERLLREQRGW